MAKGSSSNIKVMTKEGILKRQEGRRKDRKSRNRGQRNSLPFPHEFSKSCLMIAAKIVTLFNAEDQGVEKWNLNGSTASALHRRWEGGPRHHSPSLSAHRKKLSWSDHMAKAVTKFGENMLKFALFPLCH